MSIAEGWYPDPEGKPADRYWDGVKWTEQTRPQIVKNTVPTQVSDSTKSKNNQYSGLFRWAVIIITGLIIFSCVTSDDDEEATSTPVVQETNNSEVEEKQPEEIDYENLVDWVNGNNVAEYFNQLASLSFSTAEAANDLDFDRTGDLMDEMAAVGNQMKMIKPSPDTKFNEYWTSIYTDLISAGTYSTGIRNLDVADIESATTLIERVSATAVELNDYLVPLLSE